MIQSFGAVLAAPAIIKARPARQRYPIGFSTLGCPKWEWRTILDNAAQWGFAAFELRGLQGEMDLTKRPEFGAGRIAQSLQDLAALDLRITDLGASALDEGRRFIDLAHKLKSPYVRVFGDKWVPGEARGVTMERIVSGLRELGQHAKGSGVGVILETHGDFTESSTIAEMVRKVGMPEVAVLWDAHHTCVAGKEKPSETWKTLGAHVRHVHLKDTLPQGSEVRYVLTGQGQVPVREIVRVLAAGKYPGCYSLEWEKAWHPEIEEPEVAFPQYAKVMTEYLKEAGVSAG
jgi:sugar phosphate isomerase/epimerase